MAILVEVFASQPPCSGGRLLLKHIEKLKQKYGDSIDVKIYRGVSEKTREYDITSGPALVIDQDIRIIGMCPSLPTLEEALREAGL